MIVAPVFARGSLALTEAIGGRTTARLPYVADRHSHTADLIGHDAQAGTLQRLIAGDLRLAELDAASRDGAIAEVNDQADTARLLGARARLTGPGNDDSG